MGKIKSKIPVAMMNLKKNVMAVGTNPAASTLNEDLDKLKQGIGKKTINEDVQATVNNAIASNTNIQDNNEPSLHGIHNEPIMTDTPPETQPIGNTVQELNKGDGKSNLSIWKDVEQSTQEDKLMDKQSDKSAIDSISNLAEQASTDQFAYTEEQARDQSYKVKAGIMVELYDVGFMLLCVVITWDFRPDNQAKFTLHRDRKKAIQLNLYQLYKLENKKVDPKKQIWTLILGSYVPMLIVAVLAFLSNMRKRQEAKEAVQIAEGSGNLHQSELLREREKVEKLLRERDNLIREKNLMRGDSERTTNETKSKKKSKEPFYLHTDEPAKKKPGRPPGKYGSYKK